MNWQPIETAPKDGTRILAVFEPGCVEICQYDPQQYHIKPKPFWRAERTSVFGTAWARAWQPQIWQPLPVSLEYKDGKAVVPDAR